MPTYDYHCDACEHEFEHFQSIKDDLLEEVPRLRQTEAAAAVRHRRGDRVQGLRLLSDRLS